MGGRDLRGPRMSVLSFTNDLLPPVQPIYSRSQGQGFLSLPLSLPSFLPSLSPYLPSSLPSLPALLPPLLPPWYYFKAWSFLLCWGSPQTSPMLGKRSVTDSHPEPYWNPLSERICNGFLWVRGSYLIGRESGALSVHSSTLLIPGSTVGKHWPSAKPVRN